MTALEHLIVSHFMRNVGSLLQKSKGVMSSLSVHGVGNRHEQHQEWLSLGISS